MDAVFAIANASIDRASFATGKMINEVAVKTGIIVPS